MPNVVFDTVVFGRALINPRGLWGRLVFAHANRYRLIVPRPIVEEVLEVLSRPELRRKFRTLAGIDLGAAIRILEAAEAVDLAEIAPVSRDPKDDKFLATCLAAGADYLVSEDDDLLVLGEHAGTRILDAKAFLAILES